MKSQLDAAYEAFLKIVQDVPPEEDAPINEASTRLKLIDPILVDVLGWPRSCVEVELPAGEGENEGRARLDYLLESAGVRWFVVEAKRRAHALVAVEGRSTIEPNRLVGPVFKDCFPIIEKQMASYLGRYMPRFGIVTNGEQWIGFLGAERGVDLRDTYAVAFRSLDHVKGNFEHFFSFFSVDGAQRRALHRFLDPEAPRGVVHCPSPDRIVRLDEEKPLPHQADATFYAELRRAMDTAFSPIQRDPDALARCFVESQQSREADSRLERLASELGAALKDASTSYPERVSSEVEAARDTPEEGLPSAEKLEGQGYVCHLLGEASSGKTVFLRRFYETRLGAQREHAALVWIDAESFEPFNPEDVSRSALQQLKTALFGEEGPERRHLKEVYIKEWRAHVRALGLSEGEDSQALNDFIAGCLKDEAEHPSPAFKRYAAFAVRNRRILPCIIVDNIDDPDGKPATAVSWALAMHTSTFALTTVAMEDTTLWRLRGRGEDQLSRHSPEQFWLYRPKVRDVLKTRCEYLKAVLTGTTASGGRARARLGRNRQFQWTVNAEDLVRAVGAVLIDDQDSANWIGQICNFDIREVLELCKQIVLSPQVKIHDLLSSQIAGKAPPRRRVLKAILAPKSNQFQGQPTDLAMNIFGFWSGQDWAPLLPARILSLLSAREDDERNRKEAFPGFVSTEGICSLFEEHCRVPSGVTHACLERLARTKLIESYDPSQSDLKHRAAKVKITPRGALHLTWSLKEPTYVRMMAEVDPLVEMTTCRKLRELWHGDFIKGQDMANAERKLIDGYVSYVIEHARRVSQVSIHEDMTPVRSYEQKLGLWIP